MNKELIKKVEQWFIDRNLHTGDPLKQWEKLVEEFGELVKGKNKNDIDMIKDSIGDMLVVMIGIKMQAGVSFEFTNNAVTYGDPNFVSGLISQLSDLRSGLSLQNKVGDSDYDITYEDVELDIQYDMSFINDYLKNACDYYNTSLDECLQLAYDEIKDRKGKLIDGVFVKESDLNE